MSLKNLFLSEARIGMLVTVWFGTQPPITGKILAADDTILKLECEKSAPRIAIDSIIAYDLPDVTPQAAEIPEPSEPVEIAPSKPDTPALPDTPSYEPSPELVKLAAVIADSGAPDDEECADFEGYAADLRSCDDPTLRSAAEGIASSFIALRRQSGDTIDMHNIRARTLNLIREYPDESELLYCLLGSMYYLIGDFTSAGDYFAHGGDLLGIIYCALRTGNAETLAEALEEYTALPDIPEPYALRLYCEHAAASKKLGALKHHLDSLRYSENKADRELGLLVAAAAKITILAELSEDWISALKSDDPFAAKITALDKFLESVGEGWSIEAPALECDYDDNHVSPARAVGELVKYSDQKHCGFIDEGKGDCFFYYGQIPEDEPLRALLDSGLWTKLEVSYLYGVNHTNMSRAAYDVRLTPRMKTEVAKRFEEMKALDVTLTGYIDSGDFSCRSGFGRIASDDKHYSVRRAEIIDPYLWAAMTGNIKFSLKVLFRPIKLKDRYGAADVRSAEPINLNEYELNSAIEAGEITREALAGWEDRRLKLELPESEDERKIKYVELKPWQGKAKN